MGVSVKPLLMVENDNTHNLYMYLLFTHTEKQNTMHKTKEIKRNNTTEYNRTEQNRIKKRTPRNTTQHDKTKIHIKIQEKEH